LLHRIQAQTYKSLLLLFFRKEVSFLSLRFWGKTLGMSDEIEIFEARAVRAHRARAAATIDQVAPILEEASSRLLERLDDTTQKNRFSRALDLGGRGFIAPGLRARGITDVVTMDVASAMASRAGGAAVAGDAEFLPFAKSSFDLVIACLSLHWTNDLPGALIQIRQILKPGGFFVASMPVLPTLGEFRAALIEAEIEIAGGASPRISPFPELRDCAGLLQRAGFSLPVADKDEIFLTYQNPIALLRDLRGAGEGNALKMRSRKNPLTPPVLGRAFSAITNSDGQLAVTLHLATMSGFAG